ncbi:MAG: CYTH and CHAD domain-containing protein, partial [Acidimicrobiales bacterium]|nr:CYTH and CHAD domain-containing protein [Acidimicrobiales bacterium]
MAIDTHLEREIKFAVGPTFELPDLRNVTGRSVRKARQSFRTAYFDTSDLRLWSRGITLRHRSRINDGPGTWTLKLPEAQGGATLDRQEISWRAPKDEVPAAAHELLRGLIRRTGLDQVVEMATTRIPWSLRDHSGNEVAELDDDDVTVVGGPQDGVHYRQVEIELTSDRPDDQAVAAIAQALRRAGAEPDDQAKLGKALGLSTDRREQPAAKALRNATGADVVRYAVCGGLERLLDHDYRLRLHPDDPHDHDVHQARVATRRLRSNLKTLRPLLDPIWLKHTEDELRWLGTILGAVRDADVMRASLRSTGNTELRVPGWDSLAELRTKLAAERVNAVAALGEALGSPRYLDLLDRLHAATSQPPLISGSGNGPGCLPASKLMPKLVRRRWRKMEKKVAAAGKSPSAEELHRIRIAAKNLRYACELSQPVMGKPAKKTAKLAEDVQTVLGNYHDASASIDWLTEVGTTGPGRG